MLRDLAKNIGPEMTGFGDYEVWKRHVLSEYAKFTPRTDTTGPDISRNAWETRVFRDLEKGIGPVRTGFHVYEV